MQARSSAAKGRCSMSPWLRLLRPRQWIKNGFVFAPLFFAHRFLDVASWLDILLAAAAFFCAACLVYIGNDIRDAGEDRLHPVKRTRPLAAGEITIVPAVLLAGSFAAAAVFLLLLLPAACSIVLLLYIAINVAYTLSLKHIAIL